MTGVPKRGPGRPPKEPALRPPPPPDGRPAGPVEVKVRAFIDSLGELDPWGSAVAEIARRDAELLDREEGGAAATALSRELRQCVNQLGASKAPAPTKAAAETVERRQSAVDNALDQLEARRQENARKRGVL